MKIIWREERNLCEVVEGLIIAAQIYNKIAATDTKCKAVLTLLVYIRLTH
jgi:hypothetical protein